MGHHIEKGNPHADFPFLYLAPSDSELCEFAPQTRHSVRGAKMRLTHRTHAHTGVQSLRWSELIALITDLHYK